MNEFEEKTKELKEANKELSKQIRILETECNRFEKLSALLKNLVSKEQ